MYVMYVIFVFTLCGEIPDLLTRSDDRIVPLTLISLMAL